MPSSWGSVKNDLPEVVQVLLQHSDVNVNSLKGTQVAPLHQAAMQRNVDIVKLILSHPQVDVNAQDHNKYTPLMLVMNWLSGSKYLHKAQTTLRLLLARKDTDINARNQDGRTALSVAASGGFFYYTCVRHLQCGEGWESFTKDQPSAQLLSVLVFRARARYGRRRCQLERRSGTVSSGLRIAHFELADRMTAKLEGCSAGKKQVNIGSIPDDY